MNSIRPALTGRGAVPERDLTIVQYLGEDLDSIAHICFRGSGVTEEKRGRAAGAVAVYRQWPNMNPVSQSAGRNRSVIAVVCEPTDAV
jgi:hypothetical protein